MLGDATDMANRIRAVLPARWFADTTPVLSAVLAGLGSGWSTCYSLLTTVRGEARIATANGDFLDLISADFFGYLPRRPGELDASFQSRILLEMLRPRGTRNALVQAITELTGTEPSIFEPARTADTGGYSVGGVGYGAGGGWGNLTLPFQYFLSVRRPSGGGIAAVAGYGTGGALCYGAAAQIAAPVSDAEIYASVARVLPAATIGWTQITG